jgi:hypothetical protein
VPTPHEEVIWVREAIVATEAVHAMVVHAMEDSTQEAVVAWETAMALVRDVKDQVTLAEREARERV